MYSSILESPVHLYDVHLSLVFCASRQEWSTGVAFKDVRQKIHGTSYHSGHTRPEVQERHPGAQPRKCSLIELWRLLWGLCIFLIYMFAAPPLCL